MCQPLLAQRRGIWLASGGALFLSAALLLCVEPMFARLLLPKFGGVPAVWNTCLVFYQAGVLAGYGYVHWVSRWAGRRRLILLQLALWAAPLLALPLSVDASWAPTAGTNPVWRLVALLGASIGLPFFVLSTSAPMLQLWYARMRPGSDPYFLYAASNAGSMVGLLAYPTLIEPWLSLSAQGWGWTYGYALFTALAATCAWLSWRGADMSAPPRECPSRPARVDKVAEPAAISLRAKWYWLACSFVPASMLMGLTTYMTTDIAPIPLLWIVPLALYLFSFVLVFGNACPCLRRPLVWLLVPLLVAQALTTIGSGIDLRWSIPLHLTTFFVVSMVLHGELVRSRPAAERLTSFYLYLAWGGALGGLFNAILAPLIFCNLIEYPLAQIAAALLIPSTQLFKTADNRKQAKAAARRRRMAGQNSPVEHSWWRRAQRGGGRTPALALTLIVAVALLYKDRQQRSYGIDLHRERTFFGVLRVVQLFDSQSHLLSNGYTCHGGQDYRNDPDARRTPLMYYYPSGPIGQLFAAYRQRNWQHVGVIGLGVGSIAAYGEPGQMFTFVEINPAVARIARDTDYFTLLDDAQQRGVEVRIVIGDGRLSLEQVEAADFNVLVIDAFSGDAVPVHLLTAEAVRMYFDKLVPGGLLIFNITNQYLELEPVLGNIAAHEGLVGCVQRDDLLLPLDADRGKAPSDWVVLARTPADLEPLRRQPGWRKIVQSTGARV